jgi:hypothetical protein
VPASIAFRSTMAQIGSPCGPSEQEGDKTSFALWMPLNRPMPASSACWQLVRWTAPVPHHAAPYEGTRQH